MKPNFKMILSVMTTMIFILIGTAVADEWGYGRTYAVTITNLTRGQIFSPPILLAHDKTFNLFTLGEPADETIYPLAEDGNTDPLMNAASSDPGVFDYVKADGAVLPGASITLYIKAIPRFNLISLAGMLVTTNDGFVAIKNVKLPHKAEKSVMAKAYDAGSEANTEQCAFIPGPPCGNGGVRDEALAEGFIHVHAGIHGIGDLDQAMYDWRNPVAKITIKPYHE